MLLQHVRDGVDVLDGHRLVALIQLVFVEQVVVLLRPEGVLTRSISRERGENVVPEAAIVLLLDVDKRILLGSNSAISWVCSTGEEVEVCHVEPERQDLIDHPT